jgi:hypothetical protein
MTLDHLSYNNMQKLTISKNILATTARFHSEKIQLHISILHLCGTPVGLRI